MEDLYATTGLQLLPFNTIFQLIAARDSAQLAAASRLLLIPDLLAYWLTGSIGAERTNASTTQLLDVRTGRWAVELMDRVGIRRELFPPLREPGSAIGPLKPDLAGYAAAVTAVGSHDTASAVVGVPARDDRFAYISCGTWSLVGVELPAPVLTGASRAANFTNEAGVDGTVRYLRNVMGLWLLQECLRAWDFPGLVVLLEHAGQATPFRAVVDADDPVFLPPGDMPARIAAAAGDAGSGRRTGRSRSCGASWTASRWPTGRPCSTPSGCPGGPSTLSTSWAEVPEMDSCASSPPTPAGCRSRPGRPRRQRSATC
jgi:rhamnulokinase